MIELSRLIPNDKEKALALLITFLGAATAYRIVNSKEVKVKFGTFEMHAKD